MEDNQDARRAEAPRLSTIRKRADFLKAARGRSCAARGLVLQAVRRPDGSGCGEGHRVGFTVTRKVGNAVIRNRVRRRLREAARIALADRAQPGFDYVLIGRKATIDRDFKTLCGDLAYTLGKVHMNRDRMDGTEEGKGRRRNG